MKISYIKHYYTLECAVIRLSHSEKSIDIEASSPDQLEDLESELEQIAYQIRDFRMKNFPESEDIDD